MFRISAGLLKGLPVQVPEGVRPTEGKVRQAIFNVLGEFTEGARVLDGYAGSGALGLEALSRGAEYVVFVEQAPEAAVAIRDNLAKVEAQLPTDSWRVMHMDTVRAIEVLGEQGEPPFQVILLDPPYWAGEAKKALNALADCAIVAPGGVVVLEHERAAALPKSIGQLNLWKQHRYGDTVLSLYRPVDPNQSKQA